MLAALRPYVLFAAAGIALAGTVVACGTSNGDDTGEDDVKGRRRNEPGDEEEDYGPSVDPTPVPENVPPATSPDAGADSGSGALVCEAIPTCLNAKGLPALIGDGNGSATQTKGAGSQWFTVQLNEQSQTADPLGVTARLGLPAGVQADIFLYDANCTTLLDSETGAAASKEVIFDWNDFPGLDSSRSLVVEVRHTGGDCSATKPWTLDVMGGSGS